MTRTAHFSVTCMWRGASHARCAIVELTATMRVQNFAGTGSRIKRGSCWKCSSGWSSSSGSTNVCERGGGLTKSSIEGVLRPWDRPPRSHTFDRGRSPSTAVTCTLRIRNARVRVTVAVRTLLDPGICVRYLYNSRTTFQQASRGYLGDSWASCTVCSVDDGRLSTWTAIVHQGLRRRLLQYLLLVSRCLHPPGAWYHLSLLSIAMFVRHI